MPDVPSTPDQLTLVLLGKTGSGKSTLGNELLDKALFKVGRGPVPVTERCSANEGVCADRHLRVLDTPGTMDVRNPRRAIAEIRRAIDSCPDGVDAFIIVVNWNTRFTEEEACAIEEAVNVFGSECYKRAIVVFSHVDPSSMADFENHLRQVRAQVPRLDQLLNKLCNRYCPMDNGQLCATEVKQEQLVKLIGLCDSVSSSNPVRYSRRQLEEEQRRQEEEKRQEKAKNEQELADLRKSLAACRTGQSWKQVLVSSTISGICHVASSVIGARNHASAVQGIGQLLKMANPQPQNMASRLTYLDLSASAMGFGLAAALGIRSKFPNHILHEV